MRVGIPKEYMELEGMNPEVKNIVERTIREIGESRDIEIVPVSLPHTKYAIPVYYILVPSEDSSNLARLDGVRYGVRQNADSLEEVYGHSRSKGFPDEVKRR